VSHYHFIILGSGGGDLVKIWKSVIIPKFVNKGLEFGYGWWRKNLLAVDCVNLIERIFINLSRV
jgi:hypothetical protein